MFVGIAILLHQYVIWGYWFEITDIHHETFALMAFTISIAWLAVVVAHRKMK
jgi:hypothetical protein